MAHVVPPGSAGSLHWLPLAVVAMHRRAAVPDRDGPADPGSVRRRASASEAAACGPGPPRAGSPGGVCLLPPVSGPAAVEEVWSCIRSDHAVIHASWVSSQPPSPAGSAAGAGGGPASCRTGGAGSARLAGGGPSSSATSVSSATGRRRPQRANTASPPASASNSPVISHTIRVPYPGHPPARPGSHGPGPRRHPRAHQDPRAICNLSTTALPPGSSATPSLRGNRQLPIRQSTCHVQR